MSKTHTVFISHSWQHLEELKALKRLIEARSYFKVEYEEASRDTPINSTNADYIKTRLKQKILNSDLVIGLAGMYASHSDWIQWEIDTAYTLGVPIIGVVPRGKERVPVIISSKAKEVVRWNTESIVKAIRAYSKS